MSDPNNIPAMTELMPLLQAAGFTRKSWRWNERCSRASPFARGFLPVKIDEKFRFSGTSRLPIR